MSSQTIELHFNEIMGLASQIRESSRELNSLAENKLMQIICNIKAAWNSECADILTGKEVKIASSLIEEAKHLNDLAQEMESQAGKMYQREIENTRLAITRIY